MTQMNETTLPELIGSEKQIAWAEKIRAKAIVEMEQEIARKERMVSLATKESLCEMWKRQLIISQDLYSDLITCTSASKIINDWR